MLFERVGPVDVLVNDAGVARERASGADQRSPTGAPSSRSNATGAFLCTRAALPGMVERDRGRIVTVASTAGVAGARYTAAYAASSTPRSVSCARSPRRSPAPA